MKTNLSKKNLAYTIYFHCLVQKAADEICYSILLKLRSLYDPSFVVY